MTIYRYHGKAAIIMAQFQNICIVSKHHIPAARRFATQLRIAVYSIYRIYYISPRLSRGQHNRHR